MSDDLLNMDMPTARIHQSGVCGTGQPNDVQSCTGLCWMAAENLRSLLAEALRSGEEREERIRASERDRITTRLVAASQNLDSFMRHYFGKDGQP
jgi:hypothetical protein